MDHQCRSVSSYCSDLGSLANKQCRDSKDPQKALKQILAIAPILPGQKESTEFEIPPQTKQESTPPKASEDLIDFGEASAPAPAAQTTPKATAAAPSSSLLDDDVTAGVKNIDLDSHRKTMEKLAPDSTTHVGTDVSKDAIMRKDSQTDDLDEFVDAES